MKSVSLLFFFFVLLSSCSSDLNQQEDILLEESIDEPKTAERLAIEHTSLDVVNDLLSEHNIAEFDMERLNASRSIRSERACLNALYKGDVNGDEFISVQDVLTSYEIISKYDDMNAYPKTANGDSKLDVNKEYLGSDPSFWTVAGVAKLVSFDEGGNSVTYLDDHDIAVLIDIIIGDCN